MCDVFEKFICVCLSDYGLDPCHYISLPGFSWDAMLKMTGVRLEKISDIDVYLFLKQLTRGGISQISRRYSKNIDNKQICYLGFNNLYGTIMSFYNLPHFGFRFLTEKEIKYFDLNLVDKASEIGYILEVDLEYCKELHDLHNDYTLCPEPIEVSYDMLSNYCKEIVDWYGLKVGGVKN